MAKVKQEYVLEVTAKGLKQVVKEIRALRADLGGIDAVSTKARGGMDRLNKTTGELDRNAKGAAKATNNSTKAFSKMAQGMSGTLVPAYATVAANVFALTAAFGALERAADTQILIKSSEELAAQTGRSLAQVAKSMKEITDGAISMKEGLTNAALAASAGFDNSTIEELTQVARNASIALGRDLSDSMNRVFKGAIKAEPELLDELGIILRLDPATREYAASIGKAVSELTTFEKQQAVVNAVLEQGQEKFGAFSEVDPNPYTQLAASFQDIANKLLSLINIPIAPFINMLAENTNILTGALLLFSNSVIKSALPSITNLGDSVQNIVNKSFIPFSRYLAETASLKGGSFKMFDEVFALVDELSANFSELEKVGSGNMKDWANSVASEFDSLGSGVDKYTRLWSRSKEKLDELLSDPAALSRAGGQPAIDALHNSIKIAERAIQLLKAGFIGLNAEMPDSINKLKGIGVELKNLKIAAKTGFIIGLKSGLAEGKDGLNTALNSIRDGFIGLDADQTKVSEKTKKTTAAFAKLGAAIGIVGKGLFGLIPIIGQVMIAWELLSGVVSFVLDLFRDEKAIADTDKALENMTSTIDTANKSVDRWERNLKNAPKTIDNVSKSLEVQTNVLTELKTANDTLIENTKGFGEFFGSDIDDLTDNLNSQLDILKKLGAEEQVNKLLEELGGNEKVVSKNALEAITPISKLTDKMLELGNIAKSTSDKLTSSFENFSDGVKKIAGDLPSLNGVQQTFLAISEIIGGLENTEDIFTTATRLQGVSDYEARLTGIQEEINGLTDINDATKKLHKSEEERQKTLQKFLDIQKERETAWGLIKGLFSTLSTRELEESIKVLRKPTEAFKEVVKRQETYYDEYVTNIKKKFIEFRNALEEVIFLEQKAAKQIQALTFQLSLPGLNITKITDITNKLSELRESVSAASIEQATKAVTAINESVAEGSSLIQWWEARNKAEKERLKVVPELMAAIRKAYEDESKIGGQRISMLMLTSKLEQEIQDARIDRFNKLRQLYEERVELEKKSRGIISEDDLGGSINIFKNQLIPAARELDSVLGLVGMSAEEAADRIREMSDINALQTGLQATPNATIDQIRNIELQIEAFKLESKYLSEHNSLIDERLDKEFLLIEAKAAANISAISSYIMQNKLSEDGLKILQDLLATQVFLRAEASKASKELVQKELNGQALKLELANKISELSIKSGINLSKIDKERLRISEIELKLSRQKGGLESAAAKRVLAAEKEASRISIKENINSQLGSAIESASIFSDIMKELRQTLEEFPDDPFVELKSGLLAINKVAEQSNNNIAKGVSQLSIIFSDYGEKLAEYNKNLNDNDPLTKAIKPDTIEAAAAAMGALANSMDEGSSAAKGLIIAQQALALAAAVEAVSKATAAGSETGPWGAAAAYASMFAAMTSLLSTIGLSLSGGGSGGSGGAQAQAEQYRASYGSDNIRGLSDLQTNTFVDSINKLVDINNRMYGTNRELVSSIKKLQQSFSEVAAQLYKVAGNFGTGELTERFGASFGTKEGGNWLTGSTTKTSDLLAAGIQILASTIEWSGETLTGALGETSLYITKQVTKTSSGFLGFNKKTRTRIETSFEQLDSNIQDSLVDAFDNSLMVVENLVTSFGLNVETLFRDYLVTTPEAQLNLSDKTAEEQAQIIAQYFSIIGNTVIADTIPWLEDFSLAGEEMIDTLVRLTEQSIAVNEILSEGGFNVTDLLAPILTERARQEFNRLGALEFDIENTPLRNSIESAINTLFDFEPSNYRGYRKAKNATNDFINHLVESTDLLGTSFDQVRESLNNIVDGTFYATNSQHIEQLRVWLQDQLDDIGSFVSLLPDQYVRKMIADWETTIVNYFGDNDTLQEAFSNAMQVLFNPVELAQIAVTNAENSINAVGTKLRSLTAGGRGIYGSIDKILGSTTSIEEKIVAYQRLFNIFEEGGNFVDAELYGSFIALGSALYELQDASQAAEDALDDTVDTFTRDMERRLEAFGKAGKELDLLNLDFERIDLLEQAGDDLAKIALVEEYYALERADIVRRYNQEIIDSINESSSSIDDAILTIARSMDAWDEVSYQTILVRRMVGKLKKSLGELGNSIDFSVFRDTTNAKAFRDAFEEIVDLIIDRPENIQEQISLINDLREATVARYNAEVDAIKEANNAIRDLSSDIRSYLKDLVVSDISPLTNAERFTNLQNRYLANLQNINSDNEDVAAAARADLTNSANLYLEAANEWYGGAGEYVDIFGSVVSQLERLDFDLGVQLTAGEQALVDKQEQVITQLETLDEILAVLEEANKIQYTGEIALSLTEITGGSILRDAVRTIRELSDSYGTGVIPQEVLEAQLLYIKNLQNISSNNEDIAAAARADLTNSANLYLEAANEWYGGAGGYLDILGSVIAQIQNLDLSVQAINSIIGQLPSYQIGNPEVEFDQIVKVHKGEMILTPETSESVRRGEAVVGNVSNYNNTYNTNNISNDDVVNAINLLTQVLAASQEDLLEQGERLISNTKGNKSIAPVTRVTGVI